MTAHQTTFERFEHKFWVPAPVADAALRFVRPFLRCDDWAPGGQRNTSLYLDSPRRHFLTHHQAGSPDRSKLRVRAYGDPPVGPAFFEIKRKVKAVTLKRRAAVPIELVPMLLRGEAPPAAALASMKEDERRTLETFQYLLLTLGAAPAVLITCRREAFASIDKDEGVRLTVDRDICYQPARGLTLAGDRRLWRSLSGHGDYDHASFALIELKFRGVAPWWVEVLVQQLRLQPAAFSKYVAAMEALEAGDGLPALVEHRARVRAPALAPVGPQAAEDDGGLRGLFEADAGAGLLGGA